MGNHGFLYQKYETKSKLQSFLNKELKNQEKLFTELDFLKINVSTWNLAGSIPVNDTDISKWLFPFEQNYLPDMFVIGFQEIVPLTAKNIMQNKNLNQVAYWEKTIQQCLDENTKFFQDTEHYVRVADEKLVGVHIALYIKKCLRRHLKDIAVSKIKLGLGSIGNKGSCAVRFRYKDSTLAFACCHLESGHSIEVEKLRRNQLEQVIRTSFINERGTNMFKYSWRYHDIKVIFGDLNFRLSQDVTSETALKCLELGDFQKLQAFDEFVKFRGLNRKKKGLLGTYTEGTITFPPTYKY